MPSHSERVRRNYHDITYYEMPDRVWNDTLLSIHITRLDVATAMTRHELKATILRRVSRAIDDHKEFR